MKSGIFDVPASDALRGIGQMFASAGFGRAEMVSPEFRPWYAWPKELLRQSLIRDLPAVTTGSTRARRQLQQLDAAHPEAAVLFRLFTIGEPIGHDEFRRLPPALADRIHAAGLAHDDAGKWTAAFRIIPLHGLFLLADFPRSRPVLGNSFVQLGSDSAVLADLIVREGAGGARALDLCTGGGIQALLLARTYTHVDATDLNPRAIEMSIANAALNGVEPPRLHAGDLFDGASDSYDLITANPPYMYFPDDVAKTNLTGHGGDRGIEVSLRIFQGLESRLSPSGRAFIYTQAPRIGGRCVLVEESRRRLAGAGLALEFEELLRGYWAPFRDFYLRNGVEWITCYRVRARRAERFTCTVKPLAGWRAPAMAAAVAIERRGWL